MLSAPWVEFLGGLMKTVREAGGIEQRIICGGRFVGVISGEIPASQIIPIDEVALHRRLAEGAPETGAPSRAFAASREISGSLNGGVDALRQAIEAGAGEFTPDLILSIGARVPYLNTIWPNANIVHVEVGAFNSPPFPRSFFFDAQGIYADSQVARFERRWVETLSDKDIDLAKRFRSTYLDRLAKQSPISAMEIRGTFERVALLPLQVSNYYSFDEQSPYNSQFEYLWDMAMRCPPDVGLVVTEHVSGGEVITAQAPLDNEEFLRRHAPNVIFHKRLRKFSSLSQNLIPLVDGVWSISSSVGVQAALLGVRTGSPPGSQNAALAEDCSTSDFFGSLAMPARDRTAELAWYLTRYAMPEKVWRDPVWLTAHFKRLAEGGKTPDVLIAPHEQLADAWLEGTEPPTTVYVNEAVRRSVAEAKADMTLAEAQGRAAAEVQHARCRAGRHRPRFLLLNDTRAIDAHRHLGCNAVIHHILDAMDGAGFAWHGSAIFRSDCDQLARSPGFEDVRLILFNAEGSLHHDSPRCRELMEFCREMKASGIPAVLVNAVWNENSAVLGDMLKGFEIVAVRESNSLAAVRQFHQTALQVPDISFAAFRQANGFFLGDAPQQRGASEFLITDSVLTGVASGLRDFAERNSFPLYLMGSVHARWVEDPASLFEVEGTTYPRILRSLADMVGAEACVTGRFHGLVAALSLGKPVLALGSNTPKVEGLLRDIGIDDIALLGADWLARPNEWKLADIRARVKAWDQTVRSKVAAFSSEAVGRIDALFADIAHTARQAGDTAEANLIRDLTASLSHREAEVDQLRASTSWRMTAPLRQIATAFKPRT